MIFLFEMDTFLCDVFLPESHYSRAWTFSTVVKQI